MKIKINSWFLLESILMEVCRYHIPDCVLLGFNVTCVLRWDSEDYELKRVAFSDQINHLLLSVTHSVILWGRQCPHSQRTRFTTEIAGRIVGGNKFLFFSPQNQELLQLYWGKFAYKIVSHLLGASRWFDRCIYTSWTDSHHPVNTSIPSYTYLFF